MSNEIVTAIQKAIKYDALVEKLFDGATLATKMTPYDHDEIYIDCFDVRLFLKAFEPERYAAAVKLAKRKAEEKMRIRDAEKTKEAADGAAD